MFLTPGKEQKSKEKTRQKCRDVSVLPHGGHKCSGLVTWRRGPPRMRLGFKEGRLGFQEVDQAWNSVGVDLQGHSDAQALRME
ncbi:hypothetical protein PIB30_003472 [Stylosanthes scabra]|uniref:Uncharacterized protein n=1 Tax=Stylosanthes scabra TaxID=79078 RepID=A0ABU6V415_9FABA|nr:hypothetical protein [Stylosanthes scabra]